MYFATPRQSQKAKNLMHQPWAIVHAGDADDVIILEGPVEQVSAVDDLARITTESMKKYVDPHTGAKATTPNEADVVRAGYACDHLGIWRGGDTNGSVC
mgnify:CR=1 FL=1